ECYYYKNNTNWQACIVDFMLICLYFLFRGLKAVNFDVTRRPSIQRYELSEDNASSIALSDSSYPIKAIEKTYYLKIFFAVILPVLFMVVGYILYNQV